MEWISVEERLPNKEEFVLIFDQGHICLCEYTKNNWTYGKWGFLDDQDEQPEVWFPSHWMPLPDPPIKDNP